MQSEISSQSLQGEDSLLRFAVLPYQFCLPAMQVVAIIPTPRLTVLPLSGADIAGVFMYQGELATCIDLRRKYSLPPRSDTDRGLLLLGRADQTLLAFWVDEVSEIVKRDSLSHHPLPVLQSQGPIFSACYMSGEDIILETSVEQMFESDRVAISECLQELAHEQLDEHSQSQASNKQADILKLVATDTVALDEALASESALKTNLPANIPSTTATDPSDSAEESDATSALLMDLPSESSVAADINADFDIDKESESEDASQQQAEGLVDDVAVSTAAAMNTPVDDDAKEVETEAVEATEANVGEGYAEDVRAKDIHSNDITDNENKNSENEVYAEINSAERPEDNVVEVNGAEAMEDLDLSSKPSRREEVTEDAVDIETNPAETNPAETDPAETDQIETGAVETDPEEKKQEIADDISVPAPVDVATDSQAGFEVQPDIIQAVAAEETDQVVDKMSAVALATNAEAAGENNASPVSTDVDPVIAVTEDPIKESTDIQDRAPAKELEASTRESEAAFNATEAMVSKERVPADSDADPGIAAESEKVVVRVTVPDNFHDEEIDGPVKAGQSNKHDGADEHLGQTGSITPSSAGETQKASANPVLFRPAASITPWFMVALVLLFSGYWYWSITTGDLQVKQKGLISAAGNSNSRTSMSLAISPPIDMQPLLEKNIQEVYRIEEKDLLIRVEREVTASLLQKNTSKITVNAPVGEEGDENSVVSDVIAVNATVIEPLSQQPTLVSKPPAAAVKVVVPGSNSVSDATRVAADSNLQSFDRLLPLNDTGSAIGSDRSDRVGGQPASTAQARIGFTMARHIVVGGDTLWHIAKKYLGNPYRYPLLAQLSKIDNPDLIYPGDIVTIEYRDSSH